MSAAKNVRTAPIAAPAAQVIAGITIVTDSKGRKIGLKKLSASQRFLIDEKFEAKSAWSGMQIKMVASVVSIDAEGQPDLETRAELLDRLDLLGDDGMEAITEPYLKLYGLEITPEGIQKTKNS